MNNSEIIKIVSKLEWMIKCKKLKRYGRHCHVGYNLVLKNSHCISVGDNFSAGKNLTMEVWQEYRGTNVNKTAEIIVGDNVSIMDDCQFSAALGINIGNGTLLGNNVFITDNFHGKISFDELKIPPANRELYLKGKVKVGNNVWIGRNVCIMPNVTIGDGAIIGANAVVTKNIPANCVAVGIPAKVIKVL